ncbi:anticodon-binding aminoacyl-tRNA synthetase, class 1a [Tanacetum coccineum]
MVKQIVDVENSNKSADEIDKETVSFGEMQLKQEDLCYVHASIELHLHVVHVVAVKGFEGFGLVQLLDEAKSRCKAILVGEAGGELEDTEHTAEALGYGAVKYGVLKNNRLTGYTFSFDDMFKETANTAVYLKKTHARICSRFGKSKNMLALAFNVFFGSVDDAQILGTLGELALSTEEPEAHCIDGCGRAATKYRGS